ncbi:MAG: phytoene desaturase family protein [Anaerolineae bacterium]
MNGQTAVVIGAGIGGLATAGRLARAGYRVTVVEKAARAGGRAGKIDREGYQFDTGPTLFLMPQIFAETYAALGERMEDHLQLERIEPTYRIHFEEGTRLDLTGNMKQLQAQLEAIEPGSFAQALRYIGEGAGAMDLSVKKFVGRNFDSYLDYFSLANLPLIFKLKALVKHYDNVSSYFKDNRLRRAFSFQNMYLGLSPYDAPATYSLLQYTELADGIHFPRGGMYRIIETLQAIDEKLGVRFRFNAPAQSIDVTGDRTTGVTLATGEKLAADLVVANADLPYVYSELLPDDGSAARLKQSKFTSSALMFYWGVDKQYPQLLHHNVFLAGDYKASFDRIFKDLTLPDDPSFYLCIASRTDAGMAPAGKDGIMALVPVGHLNEHAPQDWAALRERARETIFARLAQIGIHDLRENIRFEETFGPPDYRDQLNLVKGAAFGLSHNFTQVGYLRPHNQHARYKNLYFAGASTHPGTGLPIVLLSARLTTERILKDALVTRRNRSDVESPRAASAPGVAAE